MSRQPEDEPGSDAEQEVSLSHHNEYWRAQITMQMLTGKPTVREYDMLVGHASCTADRRWSVNHFWHPDSIPILESWAADLVHAKESTCQAMNRIAYEPGALAHPSSEIWAIRKLSLIADRYTQPKAFDRHQVRCYCLPACWFMPKGCVHYVTKGDNQKPVRLPIVSPRFCCSSCLTCSKCLRCDRQVFY